MCSGHYFKRRLGLANGIVTAGSSVFTIALSFINQFILETHGVSVNHVLLSMINPWYCSSWRCVCR